MGKFKTAAQRAFAWERAKIHGGQALLRGALAAGFLSVAVPIGQYAYDDYHDVIDVWQNGTQNCARISDLSKARDYGGRYELCDDDKLVRPSTFATDEGGLAALGSAVFGLAGLGFGIGAARRGSRAWNHVRGNRVKDYPGFLERTI